MLAGLRRAAGRGTRGSARFEASSARRQMLKNHAGAQPTSTARRASRAWTMKDKTGGAATAASKMTTRRPRRGSARECDHAAQTSLSRLPMHPLCSRSTSASYKQLPTLRSALAIFSGPAVCRPRCPEARGMGRWKFKDESRTAGPRRGAATQSSGGGYRSRPRITYITRKLRFPMPDGAVTGKALAPAGAARRIRSLVRRCRMRREIAGPCAGFP